MRLAIECRRQPREFSESPGKVIRIAKAQRRGYLFHTVVGEIQMLTSLLNLQLVEVRDRRLSGFFPEQLGVIRHGKLLLFGQVGYCQILVDVLKHEPDGRRNGVLSKRTWSMGLIPGSLLQN